MTRRTAATAHELFNSITTKTPLHDVVLFLDEIDDPTKLLRLSLIIRASAESQLENAINQAPNLNGDQATKIHTDWSQKWTRNRTSPTELLQAVHEAEHLAKLHSHPNTDLLPFKITSSLVHTLRSIGSTQENTILSVRPAPSPSTTTTINGLIAHPTVSNIERSQFTAQLTKDYDDEVAKRNGPDSPPYTIHVFFRDFDHHTSVTFTSQGLPSQIAARLVTKHLKRLRPDKEVQLVSGQRVASQRTATTSAHDLFASVKSWTPISDLVLFLDEVDDQPTLHELTRQIYYAAINDAHRQIVEARDPNHTHDVGARHHATHITNTLNELHDWEISPAQLIAWLPTAQHITDTITGKHEPLKINPQAVHRLNQVMNVQGAVLTHHDPIDRYATTWRILLPESFKPRDKAATDFLIARIQQHLDDETHGVNARVTLNHIEESNRASLYLNIMADARGLNTEQITKDIHTILTEELGTNVRIASSPTELFDTITPDTPIEDAALFLDEVDDPEQMQRAVFLLKRKLEHHILLGTGVIYQGDERRQRAIADVNQFHTLIDTTHTPTDLVKAIHQGRILLDKYYNEKNLDGTQAKRTQLLVGPDVATALNRLFTGRPHVKIYDFTTESGHNARVNAYVNELPVPVRQRIINDLIQTGHSLRTSGADSLHIEIQNARPGDLDVMVRTIRVHSDPYLLVYDSSKSGLDGVTLNYHVPRRATRVATSAHELFDTITPDTSLDDVTIFLDEVEDPEVLTEAVHMIKSRLKDLMSMALMYHDPDSPRRAVTGPALRNWLGGIESANTPTALIQAIHSGRSLIDQHHHNIDAHGEPLSKIQLTVGPEYAIRLNHLLTKRPFVKVFDNTHEGRAMAWVSQLPIVTRRKIMDTLTDAGHTLHLPGDNSPYIEVRPADAQGLQALIQAIHEHSDPYLVVYDADKPNDNRETHTYRSTRKASRTAASFQELLHRIHPGTLLTDVAIALDELDDPKLTAEITELLYRQATADLYNTIGDSDIASTVLEQFKHEAGKPTTPADAVKFLQHATTILTEQVPSFRGLTLSKPFYLAITAKTQHRQDIILHQEDSWGWAVQFPASITPKAVDTKIRTITQRIAQTPSSPTVQDVSGVSVRSLGANYHNVPTLAITFIRPTRDPAATRTIIEAALHHAFPGLEIGDI